MNTGEALESRHHRCAPFRHAGASGQVTVAACFETPVEAHKSPRELAGRAADALRAGPPGSEAKAGRRMRQITFDTTGSVSRLSAAYVMVRLDAAAPRKMSAPPVPVCPASRRQGHALWPRPVSCLPRPSAGPFHRATGPG